jgi:hypothetical protein
MSPLDSMEGMITAPQALAVQDPSNSTPTTEAECTVIEDKSKDWEDDLLAAAEGRGTLPDLDDAASGIGTPVLASASASSEPQHSTNKLPSPASDKQNQAAEDTAPESESKSTSRAVSIKYTSTEKYWMNRKYRVYRIQQSAQKEAKAMAKRFRPAGGIMTHRSIMDDFNARFAGKYVDGCEEPRRTREQHAFGLWSAKYLKAGSEVIKGSIPDYWVLDRKAFKSDGISLDEITTDEWDTDEYLGVTTEAPTTLTSKWRKRKAIGNVESNKNKERKNVEVQEEGGTANTMENEGPLAAFSRLHAQQWPVQQRQYSAPIPQMSSNTTHLRQTNGGFDYSWALARGGSLEREERQMDLSSN